MHPLADATRLPGPAPQVLAAPLGAEIVLLDLTRKRYHRLNTSGAVIWQALAAGQNRAGATAALTAAFDVAPDVAAGAVDALLGALAAEGLVTGG